MKKAKENAFMQLFGIFGIIDSLLFVGLEMRQSQRIAIAGQYHARASMNAASIQAAIEAGIDYSAQSGLSRSSLGPEEQVQQRNFTNLAYTRIENDYYQYQQRLIDEETWAENYSLSGLGIRTAIYVGLGAKKSILYQ